MTPALPLLGAFDIVSRKIGPKTHQNLDSPKPSLLWRGQTSTSIQSKSEDSFDSSTFRGEPDAQNAPILDSSQMSNRDDNFASGDSAIFGQNSSKTRGPQQARWQAVPRIDPAPLSLGFGTPARLTKGLGEALYHSMHHKLIMSK